MISRVPDPATLHHRLQPAVKAWFAVLVVLGLLVSGAAAQDGLLITGDRLSGIVLPIEPLTTNVEIRATRASTWEIDGTRRLLLEGDVHIRLGNYAFSTDAAAVWLNRIPSADGLINQWAFYFDRVSEPSARAGFGASGRSVLVTASTRGEVVLKTPLMNPSRPRNHPLITAGEKRLADELAAIVNGQPELRRLPEIDKPQAPPDPVPEPGGTITVQQMQPPQVAYLPPPAAVPNALFVPQGVIRFSAGKTEIIPVPEGQENVIALTGSIIVDYASNDGSQKWSQLTLSAQRAIVFIEPGPLSEIAASQLDASAVHGIYLEGDVVVTAQGGEYVARAPKVYYDVQRNSAVMVEAVLRTHSRRTNMPVYARAAELRQVAANQWEARNVRVSTSEFFKPHLAIGADRMVVTQSEEEEDGSGQNTYFDSHGNRLLASDVPLFYWPQFKGRVQDIPLKRLGMHISDDKGLGIETAWNAISLFGVERPAWVQRAELKLDGYTERGVGVGGELEYAYSKSQGLIDLYGLTDDGEDRTVSGLDVPQDSEFRGVALWEHQYQISRAWLLQLQASYISDETFINAWREDDFEERREYETSAYLKYQERNHALTMLVRSDLTDFVSNEWLLASRPFTVDKLPEFAYRRYGDSLFDDRLTYSGETSVTYQRFNFTRASPEELGVPGEAFGVDDDVQLSDAFRAAGFSSKFVGRFDSRHEFAMPMNAGPWKLVPFVVGRLTGYSDELDEFSSDADAIRGFGSVGLRVNTQFSRIHDGVESKLFDLHRLRHIIEPSVTMWYGYSTVEQEDLPPYDVDVESIGDGAVIELALRNQWQTQRGGPGRWRSVNVFTLDTSIALHSSDVTKESPTGQFFNWRPEYSQMRDHIRAAGLWNLSDSFALTGESIVDLDEGALARGSFGFEMIHSPELTTYVEYRTIDASDSNLLDVEWLCRLTPKYEVGLRPQWDFTESTFRSMRVTVTRSFPDFDFVAAVEYDDIQNETTLGASIGRVEF